MKKKYKKPAIEIIMISHPDLLMAGSDKYKQQFGTDKYASWENNGISTDPIDLTDDDGTIDSQAKGNTMWDSDDDE